MRTLTLAFLLLVSNHFFAQQSMPDSVLSKVSSVKFSILDILEVNSHSFLLSCEFHLGRNVSLLSEGGFIFGKYKEEKASGYKIREEVRWLMAPKHRLRNYFGLQYMHKTLMAEGFNDEFYNPSSKEYEFVDFDYSKRIGALHLTMGFVKAGFGRQMIDLGCFIGARRFVSKAIGLSKEWSLRNDDPHLFDILIWPSDLPHSKIYLSFGMYFRYGFKI